MALGILRVADERVAPGNAALPDRLVALDDLAPPLLVDEAVEKACAAHLRRQLEQMDRIVVVVPAEPGVLVVAEKDRAGAVVVRLARQLDRKSMLAAHERVGAGTLRGKKTEQARDEDQRPGDLHRVAQPGDAAVAFPALALVPAAAVRSPKVMRLLNGSVTVTSVMPHSCSFRPGRL